MERRNHGGHVSTKISTGNPGPKLSQTGQTCQAPRGGCCWSLDIFFRAISPFSLLPPSFYPCLFFPPPPSLLPPTMPPSIHPSCLLFQPMSTRLRTAQTARWYRPFILPNTTQVYDLRDPCPFLFLIYCNSPNMSSPQRVRTQLGAEAMSDLQEDVTIQVPIKSSQTPKLSQRRITCVLRSARAEVVCTHLHDLYASLPAKKTKRELLQQQEETPSADCPLQSDESRTSWDGRTREGGWAAQARPVLPAVSEEPPFKDRCVGPESPVLLTT